jgi:DNA invertase Pin-like site-specific DNA recombinase
MVRQRCREREILGLLDEALPHIVHARHRGTKTGNAIGRPKRIFDRTEVVRLRDSGVSIEKIARQMRLGVGTVVRVIQADRTESPTPPV